MRPAGSAVGWGVVVFVRRARALRGAAPGSPHASGLVGAGASRSSVSRGAAVSADGSARAGWARGVAALRPGVIGVRAGRRSARGPCLRALVAKSSRFRRAIGTIDAPRGTRCSPCFRAWEGCGELTSTIEVKSSNPPRTRASPRSPVASTASSPAGSCARSVSLRARSTAAFIPGGSTSSTAASTPSATPSSGPTAAAWPPSWPAARAPR
jgi:hypothetical protein